MAVVVDSTIFHLAGEDELAKRIRSSTRRPPRPSEEEAAQEPSAEEGSDDEASAEPATSTQS